MDIPSAHLPADLAELEAKPDHHVLLLGQPHLQDYLDFVRKRVVGGERADARTLWGEWRDANDHYYELERSESGISDQVECRELDPNLQPLADRLSATAGFRRAYDSLPAKFATVELDRLVVYQTEISETFSAALAASLGPTPGPEDVFRFCLPERDRFAPVQVSRAGSRRYLFSSKSSDLRFLEAVLFGSEQLSDYVAFGPVGRVLGLAVGFGSNLLNVIRSDNRLLLCNGYHRAHALRSLGITHAPCVMQTVTRRDELGVIGPDRVVQSPAFYFKAARPPLLKDFFDPCIRKVVPVRRVRRVVELSFEVREYDLDE